MWLYNQRWQKFKWKYPRTSNDETQIQAYVSEVGAKEGIKLGWLQWFGLDELDAWQER
jgi:hypothetical protein